MKYILLILLVLFFSFLGYGSYLNSEVAKSGDKWIGIGVLIIAFGIMPLFILHRYKKSKLKEFLNSQLDKNREKSENQ
ncbi:MAG: hypothetical protein CMP76_08780 [Flavobacterium sp.]|uniref:hypothetical protein n=1 Tax=Flavobacterium sp. TaxID=239 RepID=UPI000C606BF8|nr:hypothetical protein [Flavobacterium sp.]MBF03375.1 hypothetical protein [Flavobacterium sp.]|tara:strand:+ start:2049 stop:2282 length:234 start_codon:yes stop_codon:yes gene_type:complete